MGPRDVLQALVLTRRRRSEQLHQYSDMYHDIESSESSRSGLPSIKVWRPFIWVRIVKGYICRRVKYPKTEGPVVDQGPQGWREAFSLSEPLTCWRPWVAFQSYIQCCFFSQDFESYR